MAEKKLWSKVKKKEEKGKRKKKREKLLVPVTFLLCVSFVIEKKGNVSFVI